MKQTPNAHRRFYLLLSLLLSLVLVRYAMQIPIPRAIFLPVIALICLLGDRDEIIALTMCCIPLHESIDFFYALVFIMAIYLFKNRRTVKIQLALILVLGMVVWELLHCLKSGFSVMTFITNVVPLLVLAVVMCSDIGDLDYAFVVRALSVATVGVCLTLFIKVLNLSGFNVALAVAKLQRLGSDTAEASQLVRVEGGEVNPNTLGIICVLTATGLMQLRTRGVGTRQDLLIACSIMVFGALTASRTYLVCLALMALLLLFAQKGSLSRKLRFLLLLTVVICLALALLYLLFPDLLLYYISRFRVKDITTGRTDLMVEYHRFIMSDPKVLLFGIGLQNFDVELLEHHMVADVVPHNAIQELVIAWGLPGVILFAALVLTMLTQSRRWCSRPGLIHFIPLIIILVKSQAGQMLNSAYTMLTFSYAYLSLCTDHQTGERPGIFTRTRPFSGAPGRNINQTRRKSIT